MNHLILDADLKKVTFFIMNEIEGYQITGRIQPEEILDEMLRRYPLSKVVLTLGENGAYYQDGKERIFQEIFKVDPVDTTAAGDTFAGYFIASLVRDIGIKDALTVCGKASSITVSRMGPLYRFHIRMRFSVRYPVYMIGASNILALICRIWIYNTTEKYHILVSDPGQEAAGCAEDIIQC